MLSKLRRSGGADRGLGSVDRQPVERKTSEDWQQEFELEKEWRRGMRGDGGG